MTERETTNLTNNHLGNEKMTERENYKQNENESRNK